MDMKKWNWKKIERLVPVKRAVDRKIMQGNIVSEASFGILWKRLMVLVCGTGTSQEVLGGKSRESILRMQRPDTLQARNV